MKSIIKKASFIISFLVFNSLLFAKDVDLYMPYGLIQTNDGAIVVADTYGNRILKIQGEKVDVIAGTWSIDGNYKDAAALEARFNQPLDVAINSKGELFVTDSENNVIRKVAGDIVTTLAGNGKAGYQDGNRTKSQFNLPSGITIDNQDNLYIADTLNHVIRKIAADGVISTIAGSSNNSGYTDGSTTAARFNEPTDLVITKEGILYVVDSGNQCIRKISGNTVTTVNGFSKENLDDPTYRISGYADGKAAQFNFPKSLTLLDTGEILIADMMNNAVRKIKTNGDVVTVLNEDNNLEAPVGLVYKNNKLYISQKWKSGLTEMSLGEDKVISSPISHQKWLEMTPYSAPSEAIQIWFEGTKLISQNTGAQVIDKGTYIPIRTLSKAIGGELKWDAKLKATIITVKGKTITIPSSGSKTKIIKNTLLGEIKYLESELGIKIDWVEQYRAIVISY